MPCANPRSATGIHRESDRVATGNAPASPIPNTKRITTIDAVFQAADIRDVSALQQVAISASARRGPILSPNQAAGIWNSVNPQRKLDRIQPIVISEKPSSFWITGAAEEITVRSM